MGYFSKFLKGAFPGAVNAGIGIATENYPEAIAGGMQAIGGGMAAAGTRQRQLGLTDSEIANILAKSRAAQSASIHAREVGAGRQVASQAAQGGTLESGLAGRGFTDAGSQADMARVQMEANLANTEANAKLTQHYTTDLTTGGAVGTGLMYASSPFQQIGNNIMAQKYLPQKGQTTGAAAPAVGADATDTGSTASDSGGYSDAELRHNMADDMQRNAAGATKGGYGPSFAGGGGDTHNHYYGVGGDMTGPPYMQNPAADPNSDGFVGPPSRIAMRPNPMATWGQQSAAQGYDPGMPGQVPRSRRTSMFSWPAAYPTSGWDMGGQ